MAKEIIGDACAFIPGHGDKNRYIKLGIAMKEGDRISIKIDTLPLPGCGWEGWINIFPNKGELRAINPSAAARPAIKPGASGFDDMADDIPF